MRSWWCPPRMRARDARPRRRRRVAAATCCLRSSRFRHRRLRAFFAKGRAAGARTIFNPAPAIDVDPSLFGLADLIILNETELAAFTRRKVDATTAVERDRGRRPRAAQPRRSGRVRHARRTAARSPSIGDEAHVVGGRKVEVADTTGAGDCFAGAVAAELSRGAKRPRRASACQCRGIDLCAADGRGAVDAGLEEVRAVGFSVRARTTAPTTTIRRGR